MGGSGNKNVWWGHLLGDHLNSMWCHSHAGGPGRFTSQINKKEKNSNLTVIIICWGKKNNLYLILTAILTKQKINLSQEPLTHWGPTGEVRSGTASIRVWWVQLDRKQKSPGNTNAEEYQGRQRSREAQRI